MNKINEPINRAKVHKKMQIIFWLSVTSIVITVVFKMGKIIFLLAVKSSWSGTSFQGFVTSVIISAAIVIGLKIYRFLPRVIQLNKVRKNHQEQDVQVIRKLFRMNRTFIIMYAVFMFVDITSLIKVNATSTILLVVKIMPVIATGTIMLIALALLFYTYEVAKHLNIDLSRQPRDFPSNNL